MSKELKSCPFCKRDNISYWNVSDKDYGDILLNPYWEFYCGTCQTSFQIHYSSRTEVEAIKAWNRRDSQ